jgi:alpha-D-xyloside xylohydrolase
MTNFYQSDHSLYFNLNYETLKIEPWGRNSLRVRATMSSRVRDDWVSALLPPVDSQASIQINETGATISNGAITAEVSPRGVIRFIETETGREVLAEKKLHHPWAPPPRSYQAVKGELFHLEAKFEAYDDEHLYGLGQHQHGRLDQKGCVIDLIQRNSEVSIPFLLSSRGYGLLWNNPAVGRVELGYNATRWVAEATPQLDYWITVGSAPAEILSNYVDATGHAPLLPDWAAGFWQSKLRYASQEELVSVARQYRSRSLPLSVIVIDFFHWTKQGEWQFDPACWPDPAAMVQELAEQGVKVMVSVWPTVNRTSANYEKMWQRGYLLRTERGVPGHMYFVDNQAEKGIYIHYYDPTHPEARRFIWERVREGYYQYGIKIFWLDACEPEILPMMPDNIRFYVGAGDAVANIYPFAHVQGFYEGMQAAGETEIFFLCRSAWAGSQRFGAAVWSGDIQSTFEALRSQVRAGLNMALSGIPWWTSDIGGFHNGDPSTPYFRELIVRWFQYGVFCPLFRLHGHRKPNTSDFNGAPNEVWSFGERVYEIIRELMMLRERLRPYIMAQMKLAHENGTPPMRPLFFDFYNDKNTFAIEDEYMFGPDLLVAPVLYEGACTRELYLPGGCTWTDAWSGNTLRGGQWITAEAPLERIALYLRDGAYLPLQQDQQ